VALLSLIKPELDTGWFAITMAVLGLGMGMISGQLGNVVQSSVAESERSEAGGVQNTAQQFGSSLGVALMGAIVIGGLAAGFLNHVNADPALSQATKNTANTSLEAGVPFIPATEVQTAATKAGIPDDEVAVIVDTYSDAELAALKAGLLLAAFVILGSFWFTRKLPTTAMGSGQPSAGSTSSA
jgi:hypothetical protein